MKIKVTIPKTDQIPYLIFQITWSADVDLNIFKWALRNNLMIFQPIIEAKSAVPLHLWVFKIYHTGFIFPILSIVISHVHLPYQLVSHPWGTLNCINLYERCLTNMVCLINYHLLRKKKQIFVNAASQMWGFAAFLRFPVVVNWMFLGFWRFCHWRCRLGLWEPLIGFYSL